jgi:hypothetical protein
MVEEPHGVRAMVSSRCRKGIKQLALLLDSRCLAIRRDYVLKECAPGLQSQSAFHVRLPWKFPVRDTSAEMTESPPGCLTRNLTLETHSRGFLSFWRGEIGAVVGWLKTQQ